MCYMCWLHVLLTLWQQLTEQPHTAVLDSGVQTFGYILLVTFKTFALGGN